MKSVQKGFTLVEIAIVLIIIGLLLGGVLKGQELVDNARIKNAVVSMNAISTAYNGYIDRFHRLPGDDNTASTRGGIWTTVTNGNGNGIINITAAQVFGGTGESNAFWQQVKAAGFITGSVTATGITALPTNPFNGLIGVGIGVTPTTGTAVLSVCLSQIPGKAARAIDTQLDDGLPNSGTILATTGAVNANTAPGTAATTYSDASVYTVCQTL